MIKEAALTHRNFPAKYWRRIRATNGVKRAPPGVELPNTGGADLPEPGKSTAIGDGTGARPERRVGERTALPGYGGGEAGASDRVADDAPRRCGRLRKENDDDLNQNETEEFTEKSGLD